jgi:uncharacterized membrane protein YfcA
MTALEALGYPASVAMGVALGLTGGGGSILTLPILVYLFGIGAFEATAYSLGLVGLVALWGAWGAYRAGDLHLRRALSFGIPGVVGVLIARRILLPMLPQTVSAFGWSLAQNSFLLVVFSLTMLLASTSMIRASRQQRIGKLADANVDANRHVALPLTGLATGLLAGFVGAGGGFLIVPALVNLGKLEMRQAIGTSLFVIALQSLLGVLGDFNALSQIDFSLFASVAALAIAGMTLGTRLRKNVPQAALKLGFGIFVLLMGTLILFQEMNRATL